MPVFAMISLLLTGARTIANRLLVNGGQSNQTKHAAAFSMSSTAPGALLKLLNARRQP
jgi:hypothetical protein